MNDREFEEAVLRRCHPDWSDAEIKKEVDAEMQRHENYINELKDLLKFSNEVKEDNWDWCSMCTCPILKCVSCDNSSCNGGGCDTCTKRFGIAIALSWARSGSLGDVEIPSWYEDMRGVMEKKWDYESCGVCKFKRLDFAANMVAHREWAEKHINRFSCEEHGTPLIKTFIENVRSCEALHTQ